MAVYGRVPKTAVTPVRRDEFALHIDLHQSCGEDDFGPVSYKGIWYGVIVLVAAQIHMAVLLYRNLGACECLIFVDSANSLRYSKGQSQTPSSWIYEEMGFSKRLRVNVPTRYKEKIKVTLNESRERSSYCFMMFSATESRGAQFSYEVDMRHFKELIQSDFPKYRAIAGDDLLDEWYKKYGVRKLLNRIIGQ